jgi:hypothetical protein
MLYTIQNNVIYTALSHLDAVTFQIVYQLKIVAALVSHRLPRPRTLALITFASTARSHAPPSPIRSVTVSSSASASARCGGSRCTAHDPIGDAIRALHCACTAYAHTARLH